MKIRNLFAAARVGPAEPLPAEAAAPHGGRQKSRLPCPCSYHFNSCMRPLDMRYDLILFIKMASALQAWCGGNCPARMAARMVALQRFDGASLNALKFAGIVLLVVAGLLGLAAGGALLLRRVAHFVRRCPQGLPHSLQSHNSLPPEGLAESPMPVELSAG